MQDQEKNKKILLHACCGICSGYPLEYLIENHFLPVVYFYNPNIQPVNDYYKRLEAQKVLCEYFNVPLIEEEYNTQEFENYIIGLESEPEKGKRCPKCFELRLRKTAQKAKELCIDCFTTSIVISPHKNFQLITQIGEGIADEFGIKYLAIDFKKKDGFLKTNYISKKLGLYRQNYCGCLYGKVKE